jgi:hypothetical protein
VLEDILYDAPTPEEMAILEKSLDSQAPPNFSRPATEVTLLPPGAYRFQVCEIEKGTMKEFKTGNTIPCISFWFQELRSGNKLRMSCRPTLHPKGKLIGTVEAIVGMTIDPAILASDSAFWSLCQSLSGRMCICQIVISRDGKWNNIARISGLPD